MAALGGAKTSSIPNVRLLVAGPIPTVFPNESTSKGFYGKYKNAINILYKNICIWTIDPFNDVFTISEAVRHLMLLHH